jgi:hypothetical protein
MDELVKIMSEVLAELKSINSKLDDIQRLGDFSIQATITRPSDTVTRPTPRPETTTAPQRPTETPSDDTVTRPTPRPETTTAPQRPTETQSDDTVTRPTSRSETETSPQRSKY